jgi:hypothetical protein
LPDGSVDVIFDELGHSGTIPAAEVQWSQGIDGSDSLFIVLTCPDGCGASSTWPVGGGADARMGQELFVRRLIPPDPQPCPCGKLAAGKPALLTVSHLKTHADQQDGTGRWQVNTGDLNL